MRKPKAPKMPKKPKVTASPDQKKKYLSKVASLKKEYNKKLSEYKKSMALSTKISKITKL